MNRSRLIILAAVAGIIVIAAVLLIVDQRDEPRLSGGRMFPDLEPRLNDVTRFAVQLSKDETLNLERRNGAWLVAEKADYPANLEQLRKVLLALARTEKVEQKTSNPEYYERLGVQDMDNAGEQTRLLRITADETTLAEVIVGKSGDGGKSYLRRVNQPVSWLGSEWIDLPKRVNAWLDAQLLAIDVERIDAVEVVHPDGQQLRIEKQTEGLKLFSGNEQLPAKIDALERVAGTLDSLSLEDIAEDLESDAAAWRTTRFITNDGLTIAAQTLFEEKRLLARLTAEIHGQAPSDPLQEEAQQLNERLGGRTFVLASYLNDRFAPTLEVLQEKPEKTAGEGASQ
ncbi:MAG: DUF4340 domain-containing protein [Gammaproteobacteria bacterium]|nr:DUF4340 domain-containing protein [Gammaproteobacteria bacterium]